MTGVHGRKPAAILQSMAMGGISSMAIALGGTTSGGGGDSGHLHRVCGGGRKHGLAPHCHNLGQAGQPGAVQIEGCDLREQQSSAMAGAADWAARAAASATSADGGGDERRAGAAASEWVAALQQAAGFA